MLDRIEALRKESKTKRNQVAFVVAISLTLVIALVWTISSPSRFHAAFNVPVTESDSDQPNVSERLSGVREYIGENLNAIQSQAELIDAANQTPTSTLDQSVPTATSSATSTATSTATTSPSSLQP